MREFKWYITEPERLDVFEIAKKNNLIPKGVGIDTMFQEVDLLKLFNTENFQEYAIKDLLYKENAIYHMQMWWWKLLGEKDQAFTYEKSVDPIDGTPYHKKTGVFWIKYLLDDEYLAKLPDPRMA